MSAPALPRRRQRGLNLIEVMVALVLFSVALVAMISLQARTVQIAMSAEDTTRAALLADEMTALMWTGGSLTVDGDALATWQQRVSNPAEGGLPEGQGQVTVAGDVATITVTWRPPSRQEGQTHRLQTQVVMP
jgi:type IV pilus assembly protein PilV